jgi:hypothetical protein
MMAQHDAALLFFDKQRENGRALAYRPVYFEVVKGRPMIIRKNAVGRMVGLLS